MPVQFSDEAKNHAIASLQRFCTDKLDLDVTGVQTATALKGRQFVARGRTSTFLGR